MNTLREIESRYWETYTAILPDEDIKPLNLEKEKAAFFRAVEKGQSYNPHFIYRQVDNERYLGELNAISEKARKLESYLGNQYVLHTKKLSEWVSNFQKKGEEFGEWLYSLYSKPKQDLLCNATSQLKKIGYLEREKVEVASKDAREFFYRTIDEYGFSSWRVRYDSMPAKIRISSAEKIIYIDRDSKFSDAELLRLSVHEIGTHVARFENGSKQNQLIYRFGFPGYLECEEGLAIFSEEKADRLSDYDIGKYCLRVIACDLAEKSSFWEVFTFVNQYIEKNQAFLITARVKRGLSDTEKSHGYAKDQLYYSGYLKVRELPVDDVRKLYVGKVGFNQLSFLDFGAVNQDAIYKPSWASG